MDLRTQLQSVVGDTYTLERELGGGGMSRVFVARETALGRPWSSRCCRPSWRHVVSVERFRREIRRRRAASSIPTSFRCSPPARPRRAALLHHAVRRGRIAPRRAWRGRASSRSRRRAVLATWLARCHTPTARHRPPRHQARQHPADRGRGASSPTSASPRRSRRQRSRERTHLRGRRARHAGLHGARSRPRPIPPPTTGPISTPWAWWPTRCSPASRPSRPQRRTPARRPCHRAAGAPRSSSAGLPPALAAVDALLRSVRPTGPSPPMSCLRCSNRRRPADRRQPRRFCFPRARRAAVAGRRRCRRRRARPGDRTCSPIASGRSRTLDRAVVAVAPFRVAARTPRSATCVRAWSTCSPPSSAGRRASGRRIRAPCSARGARRRRRRSRACRRRCAGLVARPRRRAAHSGERRGVEGSDHSLGRAARRGEGRLGGPRER